MAPMGSKSPDMGAMTCPLKTTAGTARGTSTPLTTTLTSAAWPAAEPASIQDAATATRAAATSFMRYLNVRPPPAVPVECLPYTTSPGPTLFRARTRSSCEPDLVPCGQPVEAAALILVLFQRPAEPPSKPGGRRRSRLPVERLGMFGKDPGHEQRDVGDAAQNGKPQVLGHQRRQGDHVLAAQIAETAPAEAPGLLDLEGEAIRPRE